MLLKKEKVFRDPIHHYIYVYDDIVWRLINTTAFQRLNNIRQLGGSYQVFHGAVHTRFGHSLGAYALAMEVVQKVVGLRSAFTEEEYYLLIITALLHDIGHGPYSHASESFLSLNHEVMSAKIILEDMEIRYILDEISPNFAINVVQVLQKKYSNPLISKLVSSQVDVDRMDYLLRDAYYAGVPYGDYDKDRVIRVMRLVTDNIVFSQTGVHVLEDFIMSRYHMQQQVYFNTKAQAYEALLHGSVQRFRMLWANKLLPEIPLFTMFGKFLAVDEQSDVQDFLAIDDNMFLAVQHLLMMVDDEIISTIAQDIVHRRLPKTFEVTDACLFQVVVQRVASLQANQHLTGFYVFTEKIVDNPVYRNDKSNDILLLDKEGHLTGIDTVSPVIKALQQEERKERYFIHINRRYIQGNEESLLDILKRLELVY